MKLKMLETYQSVDLPGPLLEGTEVEVGATLGAWLLEHRKAVSTETPHYGGQADAQLRHDDLIYKAIEAGNAVTIVEDTPAEEPAQEESTPAEEAPAEDEIMTTKPARRTRKK
jgi:hypothetical protein